MRRLKTLYKTELGFSVFVFPASDLLACALDCLHAELMSEEGRGQFIHYGGVWALLWMLQGGLGGLKVPADILMQQVKLSHEQEHAISTV